MSETRSGKAAAPKKKFGDLSPAGKARFLGKVVIFVVTFGFAFPTLFAD